MEEKILTVTELAKYLKLDEQLVAKMAENGKIPAIRFGDEWRFREDFIESWMETEMIRGFSGYLDLAEAERDIAPKYIHSFIPEQCIDLSLKSKTKYDVLVELVDLAECSGFVQKRRKLIFSLLEREYLCSTALSKGIAIPHPRFRMQDIVTKPFIIFGRSEQGVDFEAIDGEPTHLFFLICLRFDELHVKVLARLSRLLRESSFSQNLLAASSTEEIINTIREAEQKLLE